MSFLFPKRETTTDKNSSNRDEFDRLAEDIRLAYRQAQPQPQITLDTARRLVRRIRTARGLDRHQRDILTAYMLDATGAARIELGQIKLGLTALQKAARIYAILPDKTPLVNNLLNQGRAWLLRNDLPQGMTALEKGLEAAKEGRLTKTEAEVLYKLGVLYNLTNQPDKATQAFGRGLLICQQTGLRSLSASFLTQFGQLYLQKDEAERAFDYFDRSREIFEQENDHENLMISYGQLGQLVRRQGDYEAALGYAERGLAMARQQANLHEEVVFLQDLTRIYLAQNNYEQADHAGRQSLTTALSADDREGLLHAYELLAQVALTRQDYPQTQQWIDKGLERAQGGGTTRDQALFLNDQADLKLAQGDYAAAIKSFERLAVIFRDLADLPTLTTLYVRMGDAYLENLNQPQEAVRMAERCFELAVQQEGQSSMFAFTSTMRLIQLLAERRHYEPGLALAGRCLEEANGILGVGPSSRKPPKSRPSESDRQARWMLFAQVLIVLVATLQDLKTGQTTYHPKVTQIIAQLVSRFGDSFTLESWTGEMYERLQ